MKNLINKISNPGSRDALLNAWEQLTTPTQALELLSTLNSEIWPVTENHPSGPDHPWHYPISVASTIQSVFKAIYAHGNYAISIEMPTPKQNPYKKLIEGWIEDKETLKEFLTILAEIAYDWEYYAFLVDSGGDDGGNFGIAYLTKRGHNVSDLMFKANAFPEDEETLWRSPSMLGIHYVYANFPKDICSITTHVM